jgi:hypothetical protein
VVARSILRRSSNAPRTAGQAQDIAAIDQ